MAFVDHIARCNTHDLTKFRRFSLGGTAAGFVTHEFAEHLYGLANIETNGDGDINLASADLSFDGRTSSLRALCIALQNRGILDAPRGELFPVTASWKQPPLAAIDRAWVTHFGLPAYGVHLNGYVHKPDGLHMWIARRAAGKMTYPGELDNIVAGGQPIGLGLMQNMIKEAEEEAAIPTHLTDKIRPVGTISYIMENEAGIKFDTMFNFDVDLPAGFVPENTDGEVDEFMLLPIQEVAEIVRKSFDFKFNCNLVIIDFLIRHGVLSPDTEPDYGPLCAGLRVDLPIG